MAGDAPNPRADRGDAESEEVVIPPPARPPAVSPPSAFPELEVKKRALQRTKSGAILRAEEILEELRKQSEHPEE